MHLADLACVGGCQGTIDGSVAAGKVRGGDVRCGPREADLDANYRGRSTAMGEQARRRIASGLILRLFDRGFLRDLDELRGDTKALDLTVLAEGESHGA